MAKVEHEHESAVEVAPTRDASGDGLLVEIPTHGKLSYEDYVRVQLRTTFVELGNDFRSVTGNFATSAWYDRVTGRIIAELLTSARARLESSKDSVLTLATDLGLVERYMVWLYPPHVALIRLETIGARLTALRSPEARDVEGKLAEIGTTATAESLAADAWGFGRLRALMDEGIGLLNAHDVEEKIAVALQIDRLKGFLRWGMPLLAALLVTVVLLSNTNGLELWAVSMLASWPRWLVALVTTIGVAVVGATGAFLSALLQARRSRAGFVEYRESVLKLYLRPMVGAMVSLTLYLFLTWQIVPGFTVDNAGSYLLVAFLAGFSERYFLRLLKVDQNEDPSARSATGSSTATAGAPPSST
jgi:hypothetical protein